MKIIQEQMEFTVVKPSSLCYDYSDDEGKLRSLLDELTVSYRVIGVRKYFIDDTDERLVLEIMLERNGHTEYFPFGMSLIDTGIYTGIYTGDYKATIGNTHLDESGYQSELNRLKKELFSDLVYTVLTSTSCDYSVSIDFDEFCSEFGYDNDSVKVKALWERCLKQSAKLKRIFNDDEIACMPS